MAARGDVSNSIGQSCPTSVKAYVIMFCCLVAVNGAGPSPGRIGVIGVME